MKTLRGSPGYESALGVRSTESAQSENSQATQAKPVSHNHSASAAGRRILPEIDPGTRPAALAPLALPGGIHWRAVPGGINIATGTRALGITERRGRARRLRRSAERSARKGGAR